MEQMAEGESVRLESSGSEAGFNTGNPFVEGDRRVKAFFEALKSGTHLVFKAVQSFVHRVDVFILPPDFRQELPAEAINFAVQSIDFAIKTVNSAIQTADFGMQRVKAAFNALKAWRDELFEELLEITDHGARNITPLPVSVNVESPRSELRTKIAA